MMLSAADATIGEERQGVLNQASQELADEVQELIDKRNDVNRIPEEAEDKEESKEVQPEETEGEKQPEEAKNGEQPV